MAVGEASQTTLVQIMHVLLHYTNCMHRILIWQEIPVRILLIAVLLFCFGYFPWVYSVLICYLYNIIYYSVL